MLENTSADAGRSIAKWPFILADAVLVLVALAISSSSAALSTGQLLFCLGSVGLGAIFFATPFVLEKFPLATWGFAAGNSSEAESGHSATDAPGEWGRQARAAAEAVEHAVRANAALESSARRFDARFAPLVEVHQGLTAVVAELREAATARSTAAAGEAQAVQREFDRLRKEQAEKFKLTEEKIAVLGETLAVLAGHLKTLSAQPGPVATTAETPVRVRAKATVPTRVEEPSVALVAEPVLVGAGVAVMDEPPSAAVAMPVLETPSPEVSAGPVVEKEETASLGTISVAATVAEPPAAASTEPADEQTMLAKALSRAQSSGQTPAVAGIIMARARRPRKSKAPMPVVESVTPATAAGEVATPTSASEPEGWSSLAEGKLDAVTSDEAPRTDAPLARTETEEFTSDENSSSFRRSARAKIVALRGDEEEAARKDTPVVFTPSRTESTPSQPSDGPTQGELLAREAETIRKKRSSRSPVSACALTARVLIGIGNKPFVRGTGPGLSADRGVPMEFVEIGQWRWIAPNTVKEPITLRILKNDEVPAEGDPIVLHPGQALEVSPVFPA